MKRHLCRKSSDHVDSSFQDDCKVTLLSSPRAVFVQQREDLTPQVGPPGTTPSNATSFVVAIDDHESEQDAPPQQQDQTSKRFNQQRRLAEKLLRQQNRASRPPHRVGATRGDKHPRRVRSSSCSSNPSAASATSLHYKTTTSSSSSHHGQATNTNGIACIDNPNSLNGLLSSARRSIRSSSSASSCAPVSSSSMEASSSYFFNSSSSSSQLDGARDMRPVFNYFYDERVEESYQLDCSKSDLPSARRICLVLFVLQLVLYLFYVYEKNTCATNNVFHVSPGESPINYRVKSFHRGFGTSTFSLVHSSSASASASASASWASSSSGAQKNPVSDIFTGMNCDPDVRNRLEIDAFYTLLLWSFAPFAVVFGIFPLKLCESGMSMRMGVYLVRRRWKRLVSFIVTLWVIGTSFYNMEMMQVVRDFYADELNERLSCASSVLVDEQEFLPKSQREYYPNGLSVIQWIVLYEKEMSIGISTSVMAFLVTATGILALSFKLDFPHAMFCCTVVSLTTICCTIAENSKSIAQSGALNQIVYCFAVFMPTMLTLMATYVEDRGARMAYLSRLRAERINTTLKLDLSVKRTGLEARHMTQEERNLVEEVLCRGNDTMLLQHVAIPFEDLELKDVLVKDPLKELLIAEYHGTSVIIKRLTAATCTRQGLLDFKHTVELCACLRHPNIVLFLGATYNNFSNVGLVFEYLEKGDVYSLLKSSMQLTWNDPLLKIATDVALGLAYLHNCEPPLVHRDLKSSNLLCTATYTCKISDFGESKRQKTASQLLSTVVGTPFWLAPEVLREEKYDAAVDVYSFGIVLVELESRQDPYEDLKSELSTIDIMLRVSRGELRPRIPANCAPRRRQLIEKCLSVDPKQRPPMTQVVLELQHSIREEVLGNDAENSISRDRRRVLFMQRHQMLNRKGVRELLQTSTNADDN